jgi:hypothetical protein
MITFEEFSYGLSLFRAIRKLKEEDHDEYERLTSNLGWYCPYIPLQHASANNENEHPTITFKTRYDTEDK